MKNVVIVVLNYADQLPITGYVQRAQLLRVSRGSIVVTNGYGVQTEFRQLGAVVHLNEGNNMFTNRQ